MGYFREIPNLEYQSPFSNRLSSSSYVTAKNLFRRMKIRDDLQSIFTLFNKYEIAQGARPDTVAEELYGKASLDWVVILSAGIINLRNDWPLSDKDLYNYVVEVYGLDRNNTFWYTQSPEGWEFVPDPNNPNNYTINSITFDSTHPPETDPKNSPLSLTIMLLPTGKGEEPHVCITLASITFLSDLNQSLPCSKIVLLICFSIKEIYLFSFFYFIFNFIYFTNAQT